MKNKLRKSASSKVYGKYSNYMCQSSMRAVKTCSALKFPGVLITLSFLPLSGACFACRLYQSVEVVCFRLSGVGFAGCGCWFCCGFLVVWYRLSGVDC
jgi:hypothetical protein